jgi:hypothetical protein
MYKGLVPNSLAHMLAFPHIVVIVLPPSTNIPRWLVHFRTNQRHVLKNGGSTGTPRKYNNQYTVKHMQFLHLVMCRRCDCTLYMYKGLVLNSFAINRLGACPSLAHHLY